MKLKPACSPNPFDNILLAWLLHVTVTCGACLAVYFSLTEGSLVPLYIGLAVITALEGVWLYYRLRRNER